ncbi:unnamed protein product [Clavelina lepadiformis]|uniref:Uncharacterized protein n=1 Tax=Clavelina lepadiformis TaxID=159417 RepID=A0ABP0H1R8_CLALP
MDAIKKILLHEKRHIVYLNLLLVSYERICIKENTMLLLIISNKNGNVYAIKLASSTHLLSDAFHDVMNRFDMSTWLVLAFLTTTVAAPFYENDKISEAVGLRKGTS